MAQYYCKINGKELGPYDAATLQDWLKSGFMKPNDQVWVEGEYGRSPAWSFPELMEVPSEADPSKKVPLGPKVPQSGRLEYNAALKIKCGVAIVCLSLSVAGMLFGTTTFRIISLCFAGYNGFVIMNILREMKER